MTTRDLLYAPEAYEDLVQIWYHIGADNVEAATRVIVSLAETCDFLSEVPGAGRSRNELQAGLRSFPAGKYLIYYLIREDVLYVVRVLHGARDVQAIFAQGSSS